MFEEFEHWDQSHFIVYFLRQPCSECNRKPGYGCYIKPLDQGGEIRFYNYIPFCVKHQHEHNRLGTIAMMAKYANVCSYILAKGWVQTDTLNHPDMRGLT